MDLNTQQRTYLRFPRIYVEPVGSPFERELEPTFMPHYNEILVVDDETNITDMVTDFLVEEGYHVRVAHNGASALLDIKARRPALVLVDVAMPVMTGDELVRHLRKDGYADLPIILMTAGLHPERFRATGATDVLPKPFDLTTLLARIELYLAQQDE